MIRRLFFSIASAAGLTLFCAGALAPAVAKDKPAAESAPGDAKADKKKPGKAEARKGEAEKPSDPRKADAKAATKPSDAKKADTKKASEGRKTAEAKKPDAKKPDAEEEESATGKETKGVKGRPAKDAKPGKEKPAEKEKGTAKPPVAVGSYGDWNAMTAHGQGKDKTCYALAEPKDRQPAKVQRDKGYIFISTRPGEGVRNEVAIILGFPLKDGGAASAEIDGASFELVTKGTNAWVKNPAKEREFVDALRNGAKLVVKAPSIKGNMTTDSYSLKGLADALARVQKECQ